MGVGDVCGSVLDTNGITQIISERLDKFEASMADLLDILATDKINIISESTRKEMNLLQSNHRNAVEDLNNDIKLKEKEIKTIKGEMNSLRKNHRCAVTVTELNNNIQLKDREIKTMKGESDNLKGKNNRLMDDM